MIRSRSGVISLPIKLTVSFMILALMVPPIMSSVDSIQDSIENDRLTSCGEELAGMLDSLGSKGPEYRTWRQFEVPDGGCLTVGGDDGHIIRVLKEGEIIDTVLMKRPVIGAETVLSGSFILEMSNGTDGISVRSI